MTVTYAKDPIDFIRQFRFATFQPNPGSSAGSTRTDKDLVIRIEDANHAGVIEVSICRTHHQVAAYVADWFEKQHMFAVLPLAKVVTQTNSIALEVAVTGADLQLGAIKAMLDALINRVSTILPLTRDGSIKIVRPSYEVAEAGYQGYQSNKTIGPGQVIGHIVLDDTRTPVQQGNRIPLGKVLGNDNW